MRSFQIQPDQLGNQLGTGPQFDSSWGPADFGEILRHQLAAPLPADSSLSPATGTSPRSVGGSPLATFGDLLSHPHPPPGLLERVLRTVTDALATRHLVPAQVTEVISLAFIAAARVRHGLRIGGVDDVSLAGRIADVLAWQWVDPTTRGLLSDAVAQLGSDAPTADAGRSDSPSSAAAAASSAAGVPSSVRSDVDPPEKTPAPEELPRIDGYVIAGQIGQGATSTVWRARHVETNRQVALKLISVTGLGTSARRRFEREVETCASMEHPHIARLYDSGMQGGYFYCAIELIDGVSLERFVRDRKLGPRQIIELVATVCRAVQYTHQRGVIHRDLKPGNVLVSADGQPHVLDFGLAKPVLAPERGLTLSLDGGVVGTLGFMSPQQAAGQGDVIDTRADVYSLGAILYFLLTGRTAHDLTGPRVDVIRRIAEEEVIRPRVSNSKLDGEIETILLKSLARDPAQRYGSAGEFAADLDRYLNGEPLTARRPTLAYLLNKQFRKHRVAIALAAGIVLTILGIAVSAAIRVNDARQIAEANAIKAEAKSQEATRHAQAAEENAAAARRALALASDRLIAGLTAAGDGLTSSRWYATARRNYSAAWDVAGTSASPPLQTASGLLQTYVEGPPPLLGRDADQPFVGGFVGHQGPINCVAVSPDGKLAATGGDDGTIRLWDPLTGIAIRTLTGHAKKVNCIAFSPNAGGVLVSGSDDQTLKLWDVASGAIQKTLEGHGLRVTCVAWLPNGRQLVSAGGENSVRLWNVANGKQVGTFGPYNSFVTSLAVSPNGAHLLAGSDDRTLKLWDIAGGKLVRQFQSDERIRAWTVAFAPDGRTAITGCDKGSLRAWNVGTGKETQAALSSSRSPIYRACFSPDGRMIVTGAADRTIRLWDAQTAAEIRSLGGHGGPVRDVCFTPDGRRVISAGDDGTIRLWLVDRQAEAGLTAVDTDGAIALSVLADGRTLLTTSPQGVVNRIDIATAARLQSFPAQRGGKEGAVRFAVATPDDKLLVAGRESAGLTVWDLASGALLGDCAAKTDAGQINGIAAMPGGRFAVSAGEDGTVRVWDLHERKEVRSFSKHRGSGVLRVAVAPDGRTALSAGRDKQLRFWDLQTGKDHHAVEGHSLLVNSVAFSHDGGTAASAGNDGTIRLWEVATGRELRGLEGHSSAVFAVAFAPGDQMLASVSDDAHLLLWDVGSGQRVRMIYGRSGGFRGVAFSADGQAILSAGRNGQLREWSLASPAAYRRFEQDLPAARKVLEQNPSDPAALLVFGQWYAFRNDWASARAMLTRARAGGAAVSPLMMAHCARRLDLLEDARREFAAAAKAGEAPAEYLRLCIAETERPAQERERAGARAGGKKAAGADQLGKTE